MVAVVAGPALLFGRVIGFLAFVVARRERHIAVDNLRYSFAELDGKGIRRLCLRNFAHAGVAFAESIVVRRWSLEKIERHFGLSEDFRSFQRDVVAGAGTTSGVVGITAHLGNWELFGVMFARYLPGMLVPVAKRNSNQLLQEQLEHFRESLGLEVFYTDELPRRLFEILREGKTLGFLPDQDLKTPNGVFVDFFGRPAYTTTIPVNLTRSAKTRAYLGCLVRDGTKYRFVYQEVPLIWTGDRALDLKSNTQRWTTLLEAEIRARPEQWIWFHRRWRTRPGDEQQLREVRWARRTRRNKRSKRRRRKRE